MVIIYLLRLGVKWFREFRSLLCDLVYKHLFYFGCRSSGPAICRPSTRRTSPCNSRLEAFGVARPFAKISYCLRPLPKILGIPRPGSRPGYVESAPAKVNIKIEKQTKFIEKQQKKDLPSPSGKRFICGLLPRIRQHKIE